MQNKKKTLSGDVIFASKTQSASRWVKQFDKTTQLAVILLAIL